MTTTTTEPTPSVQIRSARGETRGVAVVLPGGKADSFDPTDPRQLSVVRMAPFARAIRLHGRDDGIAVWTVRYRYRGWNGPAASPVADAEWALAEVRRRHGEVPVVVVGHSMGGRVAIHVAGDEFVRGVAALAPWLTDSEPVDQLSGRTLLTAHGNLDVVTSPGASRRYAQRAAAVTARSGRAIVWGDMHAMLFRWRTWHRLTAGFTVALLAGRRMPSSVERILAGGDAGDFAVRV